MKVLIKGWRERGRVAIWSCWWIARLKEKKFEESFSVRRSASVSVVSCAANDKDYRCRQFIEIHSRSVFLTWRYTDLVRSSAPQLLFSCFKRPENTKDWVAIYLLNRNSTKSNSILVRCQLCLVFRYLFFTKSNISFNSNQINNL